MKKLELHLFYMNQLKKESQSIDIYLNGEANHFRNSKLKIAIKEATSFLLDEN